MQTDNREKVLNLHLEHTYELDRGYYLSFLEFENGRLYGICPQLRRIYSLDIRQKRIKHFTFNKGKGPNEISRGPFGISISEKNIVLNDTDTQRMVLFDYKGHPTQTVLYKQSEVSVGSIYNIRGENAFLNKVLNPLNGIRYSILDPALGTTVSRYKIPPDLLKQLKKSRDIFRVSGYAAFSGDYLIHANKYYGDLLMWDKKSGKFLKTVQVYDPGNPSNRKAQLGDMVGNIPPQNTKATFLQLTDNPLLKERIFLLINSKDGTFKNTTVYDYDLQKEEIVQQYKLPAPAKLIQSSNTHLFVYSEKQSEIYQYEIEKKN